MFLAKSIEDFLAHFDISIEVLCDIWRSRGRFLDPCELLVAIVEEDRVFKKEEKENLKTFIDTFILQDSREFSFPRADFMIDLAALYAREVDKRTYLVDLDISNCHGTARWLGTKRVSGIERLVSKVFLERLRGCNASFAFSFDNAKNDDFKIIVGGLDAHTVSAALHDAQCHLDDLFLFATDLPHSKYDERHGLGVGYSFCQLSDARLDDEMEKEMDRRTEDKKVESCLRRRDIAASYPCRYPVPPQIACLLADGLLAQHEVSCLAPPLFLACCDVNEQDPLSARKAKLMAGEIGRALSKSARIFFEKLIDFYFRPDGLSFARNGDWLFSDATFLAKRAGGAIGVISLKLENCAGINAILSRRYSVALTRHFVRLVRAYFKKSTITKGTGWVYHIGRNYFNILLPQALTGEEISQIESDLRSLIDTGINSKPVKSYFKEIKMPIPCLAEDFPMRMSGIRNLRGHRSGIDIIHYTVARFRDPILLQALQALQVSQGSMTGLLENGAAPCKKEMLFGPQQIPQVAALYEGIRSRCL